MKTPILLITIIAGILLAGCKHVPYGNNPSAGKYYNIRGFKMYAETYGSGEPLLMIHGNGGNGTSFATIAPYFSKKYQVIIADSRAQGHSVDLQDSISFEMMADDYAALMDSMHIKKAYIIGWSDGGINALEIAMRHPEKVIKLVASGANLWPDSTAIQPEVWLQERKDNPRFQREIHGNAKERAEEKMFMLDWQQPHIALADLKKITAPSLIMCGDHDEIRTDHTKLIYKNIPNANLWVVPNSGHGTLFEHRRWCSHNIDDFFNKPYSATNTFGSFWSKFW